MVKTFELFFNGIIHSLNSLLKGKLIYYFIPSIILGLLFAYYFYQMQAVKESAEATTEIPLVGGVISSVFGYLLDFLDGIISYVYQFIILVCFAPFNGLLAEKYDNELTGNKFDGGFLRLMNDLLRALFIVIIVLVLDLTFMTGWWILSKVFHFPDVVTDVAYFIANAFFFGLSFFDYALERYQVGTFGTVGYGFKRFLALSIAGALFILIMKIPFIGIILAPGLVTMITTYYYVHKENKIGLTPINEETEE